MVFVVIVNWNGVADTLECLASLANDPYPDKRIVVVDNGSTDDSAARIAADFPSVRVLRSEKNLGFTGGNNLGIGHAVSNTADYLLLLNNDTAVEPGLLRSLVSAAGQDPAVGIWSPVIFYYDQKQTPWFAGSRMDLSRGLAVHDNQNPAGSGNLPWLSGCAMFMSAAVAERFGGFDDRFFLNWEDVDLSLRVSEAGMSLRLLPTAVVYHKVSRSLNRASTQGLYYSVRNNLLVLNKHVPGRARRTIAGLRCTGRALRQLARDARHGRPWVAPLSAILSAVFDHLAGRYGPRGGGR